MLIKTHCHLLGPCFPTEPDYPQNVLVVNGSGVHLVGAEADLNHNLPMSSGAPLAVDTIGRFVYWYHEQSNSIARHSLNSDRMEVYVSVVISLQCPGMLTMSCSFST